MAGYNPSVRQVKLISLIVACHLIHLLNLKIVFFYSRGFKFSFRPVQWWQSIEYNFGRCTISPIHPTHASQSLIIESVGDFLPLSFTVYPREYDCTLPRSACMPPRYEPSASAGSQFPESVASSVEMVRQSSTCFPVSLIESLVGIGCCDYFPSVILGMARNFSTSCGYLLR